MITKRSALKQKTFTVLVGLFTFMLAMILTAGEKQNVNKSFNGVETIQMNFVSGDCTIEKGGNSVEVALEHNYPVDYYKPEMTQEGSTLKLDEKFENKNRPNEFFKDRFIRWTLKVPNNMKIKFSAASGDLKMNGVKVDLYSKTASGDLQLNEVDGTLELKAASGDIKMNNCNVDVTSKTASGDFKLDHVKGIFKINSASGDLKIKDAVFTGESSLHTVSGDLNVTLSKSLTHNMDVHTVSGDIHFYYQGNAVNGTFTFKGQKDDIHSDIEFDGSDGSKYNPFAKKYFKKGDGPEVNFNTVSGDITFKK